MSALYSVHCTLKSQRDFGKSSSDILKAPEIASSKQKWDIGLWGWTESWVLHT